MLRNGFVIVLVLVLGMTLGGLLSPAGAAAPVKANSTIAARQAALAAAAAKKHHKHHHHKKTTAGVVVPNK